MRVRDLLGFAELVASREGFRLRCVVRAALWRDRGREIFVGARTREGGGDRKRTCAIPSLGNRGFELRGIGDREKGEGRARAGTKGARTRRNASGEESCRRSVERAK